MSGIEIAGIALDAVQVLTTALERQRKLFKFSQAPLALQDAAVTLSLQRTILENSLSILLAQSGELRPGSGTIVEWADLREYDWTDPQINQRLVAYMGDHYEVFIRLLADLTTSLEALTKSVEKITGTAISTKSSAPKLSKFSARLKWPILERDFDAAIRDIHSRQETLNVIIQDLVLSKQQVLKVEELGLAFEQLEGGRVAGGDTASLWSIETEGISTERTLPHLSVSLVPSTRSEATQFQHDALLDTGATASCISEDLAEGLGLSQTHSDDEIWTAAGDQRLPHNGIAKVSFTWTDSDGSTQRAKVEMFRIVTLAEPMILSNDFIKRHHDVWSVAQDIVATIERIALLGFSRLRKKDSTAEDVNEQSIAQANHVREEQRLAAERAEWPGSSGSQISTSNQTLPSASVTTLNTTSTDSSQP